MAMRILMWVFLAIVASNSALHAMVLASPPPPMVAQVDFIPVAIRMALALIYIVCALGMVVGEFMKRPHWVIGSAAALAAVAAIEAVYVATAGHGMSAGSRGAMAVLLALFAFVRRRRAASGA